MARTPGASSGRVFCEYRGWLDRQLDFLMPTHVFAEDQFQGRNQAVARRLLGLRAFTEAACEDRNLPLRWVPIATISEFFTGYGSHPKGQKKRATIRVCQQFGWRPETDDEADSLALWLYAEHALSPTAAAARSTGTLWASQKEIA